MKVLVADSESAVCQEVAAGLRKAGHEVLPVSGGADLLAAQSREGAALLVCPPALLRELPETALRLRLTELQTRFLASLSHEIRTPLNVVLGMINLLQSTSLDEEQREYIDLLRSSGQALLTVINDLLDFTKLQAGQVESECFPFGVRTTVEEVVRGMAALAHSDRVEVVCTISPEVPEWLIGDAGHLRQVLANLVGNALKFTEAGEVVVRVEVAEEKEDGVLLHFVVSDTGPGIPESLLPRLFEPFTQGDSTSTRRRGGAGIGLALCRELVGLLGGTIRVESPAPEHRVDTGGPGSVFHVTLPFKPGTPPRSTSAEDEPALAGVRILVVSKSPAVREALTTTLTEWGMDTASAGDGAGAQQQLERAAAAGNPVQVVVIDRHLGGEDGIEVARSLHTGAGRDARFLMLAAMGVRGDAAEVRKAGVSAYLSKPVRRDQLRNALHTMLRRRDGKRPPLITRHLLEESRHPRRILVAEDNAANQKLLARLLQKQGHIVSVAENGAQAVHLLTQQDFDLVLMDVAMPEMDGLEATRRIRTSDSPVRNHDIPIIAMTAHALREDREQCLEAGMNDYLSKPIQREALWAMIQKHAGGEGEAGDRAELPGYGGTAGESPLPEPLALDFARKQTAADEELLAEVLEALVEEARSALQAVHEAVAEGDMERARRAGHSLKGAGANIGAGPLSHVGAAIERAAAEDGLAGVVQLVDALEREVDRLAAFTSAFTAAGAA